jgi:hypothetical protein
MSPARVAMNSNFILLTSYGWSMHSMTSYRLQWFCSVEWDDIHDEIEEISKANDCGRFQGHASGGSENNDIKLHLGSATLGTSRHRTEPNSPDIRHSDQHEFTVHNRSKADSLLLLANSLELFANIYASHCFEENIITLLTYFSKKENCFNSF